MTKGGHVEEGSGDIHDPGRRNLDIKEITDREGQVQ